MFIVSASILQLVSGAILAFIAAMISWRLKWLSGSGAWAAFGLGWVVFGLGGFAWAVILLTFFVSSSGLSKLFKKKKQDLEKYYEKGSQRDAGQVLANGFVAGLFVVLHVFFPDSWVPWTGFAAALAAANADTWATELGVLDKRSPVLITTGKPVKKGTSGAVSMIGTIAALLGSALMAIMSWFFMPGDLFLFNGWWIILIAIAGLLGCMVDSLFGALEQAIYFCESCGRETEQFPDHECGTKTTFLRGWTWLDNDWVNLISIGVASVFSLLMVFLFLIK